MYKDKLSKQMYDNTDFPKPNELEGNSTLQKDWAQNTLKWQGLHGSD